MAVEVKYVVIREGEEKMSFTSKKEADAYDKMLDTADLLDTWLTNSPVQMEDEQREALSLWLAEQKDVLSTILKTDNFLIISPARHAILLVITFYARGNSGSIQTFTLWESDRLAGFIIGSEN